MTPESIQAMIDQALLRNSTNGDGSHSSHEDNRRNVQTARPCFYADFMKCQPLNFKGTEGVVGLTRWIEKMESVFNISSCAIENQVKFATWSMFRCFFELSGTIGRTSSLPDPRRWMRPMSRPMIYGSETPHYAGKAAKGSLMGDLCPNAPSAIFTTIAHAPRNATSATNSKGNGCFKCGAPGHFKRDYPKLKNKDGGNGNAQGWVYAVGNAEKRGNTSGNPDANVVTRRELTFFLGLQVKQKDDEIFISQDKYVADILKKFDFATVKTASTPIKSNKALLKDEEAEDVDVYLYRSMIGSLMYLIAFRPDIMFAVCACGRFQVTHKVSHLHAVKRIFRYLK
ncbi:putative reverse transcriptase domain-containing protein, partial [Tanacetum coccineum]